ncbi:MAG: DUF5684 domain-containing protein [Actinomycetota bacterium]|nr:DUF5684 domain-containing protein [Actinomycetota bacterium]
MTLAVALAVAFAAASKGSGGNLTLTIGFVALEVIGLWGVFAKSGRPGWWALVPVFDLFVLLRVVGRPWWLAVLFFVPVVDVVVAIVVFHALAKSFGKGVAYTVGLLVLGFVFVPVLGFGSAEYLGPGGAAALD